MNIETVKITESAAAQIIAKTALNGEAIGLCLTVKSTGCSGNSYGMEHVFTEDLQSDDKYESSGAVLYIPKIFSWMLIGTEIDYQESAVSAGFTFNNPNESGRCGCGESFTIG